MSSTGEWCVRILTARFGMHIGNCNQILKIGRGINCPYHDNRHLLAPGKPEVREYRATYDLNDEKVGDFSDEIVITVAP